MFPPWNPNFLPSFIIVTLLTTLRSSHLLLNHLNLLSSLLYNFWPNHSTLTRFIPTQRRPTSPTIQSLKRSHTNTRMITIVVSKLDQRQIAIPSTSFFQHTST